MAYRAAPVIITDDRVVSGTWNQQMFAKLFQQLAIFFYQFHPRFGVLSAVIPEKFCSNQLNFCNDTFIKTSICVFFATSGFTV